MPLYEFHAKNVRDGSTDWKAGQALTQEYEAVCDAATVDAGDVIAALATTLGVFKGAPHPTYAYARCTNVAAAVEPADPFRWNVTATFLEPAPQPGAPVNPAGGQPDPPARDPWVTGSFRREDVYRDLDVDGVPLLNTAGDPFDDPPAMPVCVGQFNVTRYFDDISYFALKAYENKTNSDTWQGFPVHSLCIMGVTWAPHSERSWSGWKVVFTVEHREVTPEQLAADPTATGGFHPVPVLDRGWYEWVDVGEVGDPLLERQPYMEPADSGVPKTVPGFLNGTTGERSATPVFVPFRGHDEISFAVLG